VKTRDDCLLADAVAELERALDRMEPAAWSRLSSATARALTDRMSLVITRAQAQRAFGARAVDRSEEAKRAGVASTADLLGMAVGHDRNAGAEILQTGEAAPEGSRREEAMASGHLTPAQAKIVAKGLDRLPETVTPEQAEIAECELIAAAQVLTPKDLRKRADRVADTFMEPAEVDAVENDVLVDREAAAREKTTFVMSDNGDGTHSGRFTLPDLEAAFLRTAVDAHSSPQRGRFTGARDESGQMVDSAHRQGLGFAELVSELPEQPEHGGTNATMVVTVSLETLQGALTPATLSTGQRISAGAARRLASTATIIPMVLGSESVPLDVGRAARLASRAQRLALAHRDGGCTFPGCDRPPGWAQAHHILEWFLGGRTDLTNLALLCAYHHRLIDELGIPVRLGPESGHVEFLIEGRWRRNLRYRSDVA
jgi:hypothetical protein